MKPLPKAVILAGVVGVLVFGVAYVIGYQHLLAHQPPTEPGKPWPADVTSFPPSAAWISALPCGGLALILTFVGALIIFNMRQGKRSGGLRQNSGSQIE